jgi:preprotein translocase subunit SecD
LKLGRWKIAVAIAFFVAAGASTVFFFVRRPADIGDWPYLLYRVSAGAGDARRTCEAVKWTLRNRLEQLEKEGAIEDPELFSPTYDRLIVRFRRARDIAYADSFLRRPARLEFRLVDDEGTPFARLDPARLPPGVRLRTERVGSRDVAYLTAPAIGELEPLREQWAVPSGREIAFGARADEDRPSGARTYLLHRSAPVTGDDIVYAHVEIDERVHRPYVSIELNRDGAKRLEQLTAENIKNRLAIVLDGEVNSAPMIQGRIAGGRMQITVGGFKTYAQILVELKDLSLLLRTGALAAPIELLEKGFGWPR